MTAQKQHTADSNSAHLCQLLELCVYSLSAGPAHQLQRFHRHELARPLVLGAEHLAICALT